MASSREPEPPLTSLETDEEGDLLVLQVTAEAAGQRLDKTLASLAEDLSRARIQGLLAAGAVSRQGETIRDGAAKALAGPYEILVPAVVAAEPEPQAIALRILFEDSHLIVIDKPAGMAVHPAPGSPDRTLVNALLHHCGASLSGIGGVARPGIVHRLDKDTSGVLVCAKSDAAHQGLSALFFHHDIDRAYVALTRGAPKPRKGTVQSLLGRSAHDRKKMAVLRSGGREAITHYETTALFGPADRPTAARVRCRLETGRTHQIRVHMASKGSPCLGDQVYGSGSPAPAVRAAMADAGLARQALHAAVLGFIHPITGEPLRFEAPLPDDMARLEALLGAL
ncbi:MAG: RluA family pseudouridine synthase [Phenylobacterium sp.]|nr:RluA family pseudouridine synthase [Phenylobacterium sp.]